MCKSLCRECIPSSTAIFNWVFPFSPCWLATLMYLSVWWTGRVFSNSGPGFDPFPPVRDQFLDQDGQVLPFSYLTNESVTGAIDGTKTGDRYFDKSYCYTYNVSVMLSIYIFICIQHGACRASFWFRVLFSCSINGFQIHFSSIKLIICMCSLH